MILRLALLSIFVPWFAACAGGTGNGAAPGGLAGTYCSDPRPEICTMEYLPVCGRLRSGERRSYANACSACADPQVEAHRPGACE